MTAGPARFSPADPYSKERVILKSRFGLIPGRLGEQKIMLDVDNRPVGVEGTSSAAVEGDVAALATALVTGGKKRGVVVEEGERGKRVKVEG